MSSRHVESQSGRRGLRIVIGRVESDKIMDICQFSALSPSMLPAMKTDLPCLSKGAGAFMTRVREGILDDALGQNTFLLD